MDEATNSYKQCGAALHVSGSLEFIWNFRVVDRILCKDHLRDGFIEDIDSDFGFIYYKKIDFEAEQCLVGLKDSTSKWYRDMLVAFGSDDVVEQKNINSDESIQKSEASGSNTSQIEDSEDEKKHSVAICEHK